MHKNLAALEKNVYPVAKFQLGCQTECRQLSLLKHLTFGRKDLIVQTHRRFILLLPMVLTLVSAVSMAQEAQPIEKTETAEEKQKRLKEEGWISLLPAEGMGDWEASDFFSPGKVRRDGAAVILEMGEPLTGITYTKKDFPKNNFEISLEAKRIEGGDFLCGLTFPVDDGFCSLIAGGWGGGVVGLSSIDGADASENETTTYQEFENGKWYPIRLRVESEQIRVWIDDQEFFRLERYGQEFSTRIEVEASKPLGYCAFQSKVALRDFRWRPIKTKTAKQEGDK